MIRDKHAPRGGTYFFSVIRAAVVLLVILLHAALAYAPAAGDWWILSDNQKTILSDILSGVLDITLMPILFFIAGYFAVSSFEKCSGSQFVLKKLKNLMLPWLIGVLFLNPFLVNVIHFQTADPGTIVSNTLVYFQNFIRIPEHLTQDRSVSPLFFSHYHLWFLSLLFYFFMAFALFQRVFRKTRINATAVYDKRGVLGEILLALLIASLGYSVLNHFFGERWFVISIVQFQISRLVPYLVFFIWGIRSFRSGWVEWITLLKRPVFHFIPAISLTLLYLALYNRLHSAQSFFLKLPFGLLRYTVCIYSLLIALGIGQKYFNGKTAFRSFLIRNSFGVYIIHLNSTILYSFLFTKITVLPPELKLLLVFLLSVSSSYLVIFLLRRMRIDQKERTVLL